MTYPPQPGPQPGPQGGWQPGPPGGPQGGWQGPPGGFPHQGGYGGGPGMPPGGEPPKKTGLIVGLSLGGLVLLFGVFAILAWVAPGFLLGDDESSAAASEDGGSGRSATDVARQIIQGFNNRDTTALERLTCEGADEEVTETIGRAGQVDQATLIGDAQESGDTATASAVIVVAGSSMEVSATLANDGGWCWQSVTTSGSHPAGEPYPSAGNGSPTARPMPTADFPTAGEDDDPAPGDSSATAQSDGSHGPTTGITDIRTLGRKFVTAVNSGDAATAKSLGCPDYELTTADAMVEDGRQLRITSVSDDAEEPSAELVATHSDGDRSEYSINAVRDAAAGDLCIDGLIYYIPDEG